MHNLIVNNASEAFERLYLDLYEFGEEFDGTKALFNVGIHIDNPHDNEITTPWRKWSKEYAQNEWQWYLSKNRNLSKLEEIHGSIPPIWKTMCDDEGNVQSNYGWQLSRNDQLGKVIDMLHKNPNTRRAVVSIYDGKEIPEYKKDTPCTYCVQFTIIDGKLNMSVYMRSCDVWFGLCNDLYCFSELQKYVAGHLCMEWGWYYHHAHNLHLYKGQDGRHL